jgi:integrase
MASFYKRGKTWSFSIDIGFDKDGKRLKKGIGGFRLKQDAIDAAAELTTQLSQGTYIKETDITFREFAKSWLDMYSHQVKKSSVRVRQHEVNNLQFYFNNIKIKDVTKKQYQDSLLDLQKRGFAENTIAGIHGTARMLFRKAIELDLTKNDPTQYARPPRTQETLEEIENSNDVPIYLEKNDLATFLRFSHDAGLNDDYTIFLLLAYTGIRAGELCALKWQDIDFDAHTIKITRTYYNPKNSIRKYELQTPKTKASRRTIEISQRVVQELKLHQARQNISKITSVD